METHLGWLDYSDFTVAEFCARVQSILSRVIPILYIQRGSMQDYVRLTNQGFIIKQYDGFQLGKCLGEDEKRINCVLQRHFERCTTLVSFSEPSVQYITGSLAERLAKRLCHSLPPLLPTFLQQTHTEVHYNESLSEEGKLTPAHADESCPYPNGPKLLSHLEAMSHVVLHRESPELSTNTPYTS